MSQDENENLKKTFICNVSSSQWSIAPQTSSINHSHSTEATWRNKQTNEPFIPSVHHGWLGIWKIAPCVASRTKTHCLSNTNELCCHLPLQHITPSSLFDSLRNSKSARQNQHLKIITLTHGIWFGNKFAQTLKSISELNRNGVLKLK